VRNTFKSNGGFLAFVVKKKKEKEKVSSFRSMKDEKHLYFAASDGDVEKVKEILRDNPSVNVNYENDEMGGNGTTLFGACAGGKASVVSILLAHPDIDVNLKSADGWTPFTIACFKKRTSCVLLLLGDSRVDLKEGKNTPPEIIKWWIASGREMALEKSEPRTIGKVEGRRRGAEEDALLERFTTNPEKTRAEIRQELGITGTPPHFPIACFFLEMTLVLAV